MSRRRRVGPTMAAVVAYVSMYPGRAMLRAARWAGPRGSAKFGYRSVHRCLAARLIIGVPGPRGSTLLYPAPAKEGV